ncbi:MAG TPA: asparagine synthase (glutamine-hydrolyzing) [Alphaproteobacteria bacterium]|nr:asparagine synthase (glutamine-hydrolyzing) [Alphaproteobacteria bacterium]
MCGIAGVMMGKGRPVEPGLLERLAACILHRGPDGTGIHRDGAVGMVSTRLAIVDLRTGDQPIYDSRRGAIVANGEIYNNPELRARLTDVPFQTRSDCEPPLHLYRRLGLDFTGELRGMYALAIHDPEGGRLVLARDPFGIKPLYYVERPDGFAFASEPQALLAAGLAERRLNPRARAELLQLKFTTGRETIFAAIHRVLPGETIVVADGRIVERRRRPAIPQGGPRRQDHGEAMRALDEVLSGSVEAHLRADVPYGLYLSGGIDSSVLAGLMTRFSANPVVAFTVGFPGSKAADETEKAKRVARAVGADHHVLELTERDFWTLAPRAAEAVDDPTTDAAILPTFALGEATKGRLKVVLSGEGADEIFGGYARYRRARWLWGLLARKARLSGEFDELAAMRGSLAGWRDNLARVEADESLPGRSAVQRLQAVDCADWLPNDLLIKLDRCLMANSVEGRTPFLDPLVADFAFRLPDALKVTNRFGKKLLRDWLARNVPASEPYSRKTGFKPPVGEWIAARKAAIVQFVAAQPGIAEIATDEDIGKVFAAPERNSQAAWSLLFYALWHSRHILGVPPEGTVEDVLAAARRAG